MGRGYECNECHKRVFNEAEAQCKCRFKFHPKAPGDMPDHVCGRSATERAIQAQANLLEAKLAAVTAAWLRVARASHEAVADSVWDALRHDEHAIEYAVRRVLDDAGQQAGADARMLLCGADVLTSAARVLFAACASTAQLRAVLHKRGGGGADRPLTEQGVKLLAAALKQQWALFE